MKKKNRRLSLTFIILGFITVFVGLPLLFATSNANQTAEDLRIFYLILFGHDILIVIGGFYWLKDKNRSPWWTLLAFFSGLGLIFIGLLKDKSIEKREKSPIDQDIDITKFKGLNAKQLYKEAYCLFEGKDFAKAGAITNYLIEKYPKSKEARWAYENIEKKM